MKTYKFDILETTDIYFALNYAIRLTKLELENDIKLDLQMSCKSLVEKDKATYATLCKLRDIVKEHNNIKIVGD